MLRNEDNNPKNGCKINKPELLLHLTLKMARTWLIIGSFLNFCFHFHFKTNQRKPNVLPKWSKLATHSLPRPTALVRADLSFPFALSSSLCKHTSGCGWLLCCSKPWINSLSLSYLRGLMCKFCQIGSFLFSRACLDLILRKAGCFSGRQGSWLHSCHYS